MMHHNQPITSFSAIAWVVMLTVSLGWSVAWAAEQVKINSLVTYPQSYNMRIVRVEGTVTGYRMNHFIGARSKLEKCIQEFSVEDEAGIISASYASLCGNGVGPVILRDGDRVTIEAHFSGVLDVRSVRKN